MSDEYRPFPRRRLGTVQVAGHELDVTGLALLEGLLVITASAPAIAIAWPPVENEPATVLSPDGARVCHGWRVSIPAVKAGMNVLITLPIHIESLTPGELP